MNKLKIFCVTNEKLNYLENLPLTLVGVGKKKIPKKVYKLFERKKYSK